MPACVWKALRGQNRSALLATLVSPRATLDFSRAILISFRAILISSHAIVMDGGGGARRGVTIAESKSEPG